MRRRPKRSRRIGRAAASALLVGTLLSGARGEPPQERGDSLADPDVRQLFDLVNAHRRSVGCPPLAWHARAALVARRHSADMADRRYFDHRNPEGEWFSDRLVKAGVRWSGGGAENLALTPAGPGIALEMWLDSPHHRANIQNCRFTHEGIGVARGFWTQILVADPVP